MKKVITERDVIDLIKNGHREILCDEKTILTPSAKDAIQKFKVKIIEKSNTGFEVKTTPNIKTIAIGADHTGFKLKEDLKKFLEYKCIKVEDVGTFSEQSCDYPEFAFAVAQLVAQNKVDRGIVIDATGIPSAICANKVHGIRCAIGFNEYVTKSSREHNDSNVISFGARVFSQEIIKSILEIWLSTPFEGGRHQKRLEKINDIEQKMKRS